MTTPDDLNKYVEAFNNVFSIFRFFKQLIDSIRMHRKPGYRTIQLSNTSDIRDALANGDIAYGDKIRLQGYFSRYAHLTLPPSYMNSIYDRNRADTLKRRRPNEFLLGVYKAAQIPVSSVQPVSTGTGKLHCAFLYSANFAGFLYNQPVDPRDSLKAFQFSVPPNYLPRVRIPEYCRPVPVIFSEDRCLSLLEHKVEIEARVQPIPAELSPYLRMSKTTFFDPPFTTDIDPPG